MRLNHNLMSLNVYRAYNKNLSVQSNAMNKISSGYKVNKASEDPNAIGQTETMRLQIKGLQMAQRNMQDGISMLQTAEGGLDNITGALQRIKELTVSAGGATTDSDKEVIQAEINQMVESIKNAANNTEFNGIKLIGDGLVTSNNNPQYIQMASGSNVGEKIGIPTFNLKPENLGDENSNKTLLDIDLKKAGGIDEALKIVDGSIDTVLSVRSKYGALENRLESMYDINGENAILSEKALSTVEDADVALEMMELAKSNVLVDAGNAMMAQTNRFPQDILRVLERLK